MKSNFAVGKKVKVIENAWHCKARDSFVGRIFTLKELITTHVNCPMRFWRMEEKDVENYSFLETELELLENIPNPEVKKVENHNFDKWIDNNVYIGKCDGKWVEGYFYLYHGIPHIIKPGKDLIVTNVRRKISLYNYIGYEGNIVETVAGCGIVRFNVLNGSWCVELYKDGVFNGYYYFDSAVNGTIKNIGNVVDNPEILKERCGI